MPCKTLPLTFLGVHVSPKLGGHHFTLVDLVFVSNSLFPLKTKALTHVAIPHRETRLVRFVFSTTKFNMLVQRATEARYERNAYQ